MFNKKLDRRSAVKSVLAISGFGLVATSFIGKALLSDPATAPLLQVELTKSEQYIFDLVSRNASRTGRYSLDTITDFSRDFVKVLGQNFDYPGTFPPIFGEIEIMRCFDIHVV